MRGVRVACLGATRRLCGGEPRSHTLLSVVQAAWKHAIQKARAMPDPWAEFHLEDIETEPCIRYRSASPRLVSGMSALPINVYRGLSICISYILEIHSYFRFSIFKAIFSLV